LGSEVDLLEKFVAKELLMLSRVALGRGSFLVLWAALVLIALGTPLGAQEVGLKIGVFNADRVLAESDTGQQALALFNQLRDQRIGEMQVQQDEINGLQQQAATATPGTLEAARLERDLEDRLLRFDRLQQDVQQELGLRQNELTVEITEMVSEIISTMGQEEGYTIIFNTLQSGLVYVSPTLDLTDEIIGRVNALSAPDPA
jgi:Skp family chaperone for outer membrane proteins